MKGIKVFPYERYVIQTELSLPILQRILSEYIYPGAQWDESKLGRREFFGYLDEEGFDIQPPPIGRGMNVLMQGKFSEQEGSTFIEVTARMYGEGLAVMILFAILGPISLVCGLKGRELFGSVWGAMVILIWIILRGLWWNEERKYKDILCKRIGNGAHIVKD